MRASNIGSTSPFRAGGGVEPGEAYVERSADSAIFSLLRDGDYCYVLAPRQSGKTSLAKHTVDQLARDGVVAARIDLALLVTDGCSEAVFYRTIADSMAQGTGLWSDPGELAGDIEACFGERRAYTSTHNLREFLTNKLLPRCQGRVVFFIDELDALMARRELSTSFIPMIRALFDGRSEHAPLGRLTFCLLGVYSRHELNPDPDGTPLNIGAEVELDDFAQEETLSFSRWLGGVQQPEILLDEIYEWTRGVPWMTQRLIRAFQFGREQSSEGVWRGKPGDPHNPEAFKEWVEDAVGGLFLGKALSSPDKTDDIAYAAQYLTKPRDGNYGPSQERSLRALKLYRKLQGNGRKPYDPNDSIHSFLYLSGLAARQRVGDDDSRVDLVVRNPIYESVYDRGWLEIAERHLRIGHRYFRWAQSGRQQELLLDRANLESAIEQVRDSGSVVEWGKPDEREGIETELLEFLMFSAESQRQKDLVQLRGENFESRQRVLELHTEVLALQTEVQQIAGSTRRRMLLWVVPVLVVAAIGLVTLGTSLLAAQDNMEQLAIEAKALASAAPEADEARESPSVPKDASELSPDYMDALAGDDPDLRAYLEAKHRAAQVTKEHEDTLRRLRRELASMRTGDDFTAADLRLLRLRIGEDVPPPVRTTANFLWLSGIYLAAARDLLGPEESFYNEKWSERFSEVARAELDDEDKALFDFIVWRRSAVKDHNEASDAELAELLGRSDIMQLSDYFPELKSGKLGEQLRERKRKRRFSKRRVVVFDCANELGTDDPVRGRDFVQLLVDMGFGPEGIQLDREPLNNKKKCDLLRTDECRYVDADGRALCEAIMKEVRVPGSKRLLGEVLELRATPSTKKNWNMEVGSTNADKFRQPIREALFGSGDFQKTPTKDATAEIAIRLGRKYYYADGGE